MTIIVKKSQLVETEAEAEVEAEVEVDYLL